MTRLSTFVLVVTVTAAGFVTPTLAQSSRFQANAAARYSGLYDMAPQYGLRDPNDPAVTGGGSTGYNQMIYNAW